MSETSSLTKPRAGSGQKKKTLPARPADVRDDRKSTAVAAACGQPAGDSLPLGEYALVRAVLRNEAVRRMGLAIATKPVKDPRHAPLATLEGPQHTRKRATLDHFFTPEAIASQHHDVIEATTARLLNELRENGEFILDDAAFALSVAVVAHIIGLVSSEPQAMASRLEAIFEHTALASMAPLSRRAAGIRHRVRVAAFLWKDLRPAIRAHRKRPRPDILSQLLSDRTPEAAILSECLSYAASGILPTREFLTMAAWHLLGSNDLRTRFLREGEEGQTAILEEILRIEPVAGYLYRRPEGAVPPALSIRLTANTTYALDIRAANFSAEAGSCPFAIDPDRVRKSGATPDKSGRNSSGFVHLSFGDGPHRCPGAPVALHLARIFLDRLLRVPGVRLEQEPTIGWNEARSSYELRGARICYTPA